MPASDSQGEYHAIRAFVERKLAHRPGIRLCHLPLSMPVGEAQLSFLADSGRVQEAYEFSCFVNSVPERAGDWITSSTKLWNVYRYWLERSVPAPRWLTEADQRALEEARRYCDEHYATYRAYKAEYDAANAVLLALQEAPAAARGSDYERRLAAAQARLTDALHDWELKGNRTEFERRFAQRVDLGRRDVALVKKALADRLGEAERNAAGAPFHWTTLSPASHLAPSTAWPRYTLPLSPGAGETWQNEAPCLWISGSESDMAATSHTSGPVPIDPATPEVRFEMIAIGIERPWFSGDLLGSRAWKWVESTARNPGGAFPLSDGGKEPRGHLIMYAVELVLARRIEVKVGRAAAAAVEQLPASEIVGFGPFQLGARRTLRLEGDVLSQDGMLVVALACQVLPKSPDPDFGLWSRQR
jgi:hypothetical protein